MLTDRHPNFSLAPVSAVSTEEGTDDRPPKRGAVVTPSCLELSLLESMWHLLWTGGDQ
jgi:hypothetical protein